MEVTRRQQSLMRQSRIKLISFIAVILALLIAVVYVQNMLLSSLLAFVISYTLAPVVTSLERAGINRILGTAGVFIIIGLLLVYSLTWLAPLLSEQLNTMRIEAPKYISGISRLIADTEERLELFFGSIYTVDLSSQIESKLYPWATSLFEHLPSIITKLFTTLMLAPFIAFFLIKDGRQISRKLLALVPNSVFEPMLNLHHQINDQMGQFVRARFLEAIIVGFVTWLGLFLIDFPFAVLLAAFAALTNLIPYVGPIIGAIPAIIIALTNGESSLGIFLVIFVYFIAQLIDAAFIIPLVVAKIVDLHPVTVVVAIIIGAQLMGVLGMLISIPVASVLKVTLGTVYRLLTDDRA